MCEKTIDTLIKARYPLLLVQSYEEHRVVETVERLAKEAKASFLLWSITKGIRAGYTEASRSKSTPDPKEMLLSLTQMSDSSTVVLLQDFHPYLNDPVVVRALRDLAEGFRTGQSKRTLVLCSPSFATIPPEIEKLATLLDWDLPSEGALLRLAASSGIPVKDNSSFDEVAQAALGLTEMEAENAYAKSAVMGGNLDCRLIQEEKKQIIKKSGLLEYLEPSASFGDVGGLDILKTWISQRRQAYTQRAMEFHLPKPKGVLLLGPPGTGKSLVAKAFSAQWGFPLLQLDLGKVFQGLVGSSEENMRKVLKTAEAVAPCILYIDEIEKGLAGAGGGGGDGGTTSRVFGTFLTWMQEKKHDVFVVATANNVSQLPPELLRKGRFDELFFIDLPGSEDRRKIFEIHIEKVKRDPGKFDLFTESPLIRATEGYTGAEIEQIVHAALFLAFDRGKDLTGEYLIQAQGDTLPLSSTMKEKIDSLREWSGGRARPASTPTKEPVPVYAGRFGGLAS